MTAGGVQQTDRRYFQSVELAEHRDGQTTTRSGGISRRQPRIRVPDFPARRADRVLHLRARLRVLHRQDQPVADHESRDGDGGRLCRHEGAGNLPVQQDQETPVADEPGLPQHGGPADHLRRIRHVDRARGAQGQPSKSARKASTSPRNCRCSPPSFPISSTGAPHSKISTSAPAWNRSSN